LFQFYFITSVSLYNCRTVYVCLELITIMPQSEYSSAVGYFHICQSIYLLLIFIHHSCWCNASPDVKFLCFITFATSFSHLTSGCSHHLFLPVTRSLFANAICFPPCKLRVHAVSTCCFTVFPEFCVTCIFFL
jgi:hypothetical protein